MLGNALVHVGQRVPTFFVQIRRSRQVQGSAKRPYSMLFVITRHVQRAHQIDLARS